MTPTTLVNSLLEDDSAEIDFDSFIAGHPSMTSENALYLAQATGRTDETDLAVLQDPEYAYMYARDVIDGAWPAAERVIAEHPKWAYRYAKNVLNGKRFLAGEPVIATDPTYAYWYAVNIIRGPWPPGEAVIGSSTHFSEPYSAFLASLRKS